MSRESEIAAEPDAGGSQARVERQLVIRNREGLHFRPIMQLVEAVTPFAAKVTVSCDGRQADGRSPMELLMLVAAQGATMTFVAEGPDAQAAIDAVARLIEAGFDEPMS